MKLAISISLIVALAIFNAWLALALELKITGWQYWALYFPWCLLSGSGFGTAVFWWFYVRETRA